MFKRQHYIALASVVVVALILLNLPSQTAERIKLAIGSLFLPLFGISTSTSQLSNEAASALLPRRELFHQNERLLRENKELRLRAMQAEEIWRENNQLRQQLNWQKTSPWNLKLARVIVRDPSNWWKSIQIDLGSRDGLKENLPVLTPDGLVGRVSSVGYAHSQVVLIGDPNCQVAALIQETRDNGVITAASFGPLDNTLVDMSYLPNNSILKPGQTVVTSGLGGVFPKGIRIGQVVDSQLVEYGLYTEARVKLAANLGALEEVWILFP